MYNDTIKVANKIITDSNLLTIFEKMNDELIENNRISKQEIIQNEKIERQNQRWTMKNFEGSFRFRVDFYDDTNVVFDDYCNFIAIYNSRLHEIKNIDVNYRYSYWIKNGIDDKFITQSIRMDIFESKMSIDINISSADKKMDDIYRLIKEIILQAPERYDRVIKKKNSIINKIAFAIGVIPSLIICTLLAIIPTVRELYSSTYLLFPITVIFLGYIIGNTFCSGKLSKLYSTIIPSKKYVGYDTANHKSMYKDDIDKYVEQSEIVIGKNINNIKNRKEIINLESKYKKFIPVEIIIIISISLVMILLGFLF